MAQRLYFNPRLQLPAHHHVGWQPHHAPRQRRRIGVSAYARPVLHSALCTLYTANSMTSDVTMSSASVQTVDMGLPIANHDRSSQNWRASTSSTRTSTTCRRYHPGQSCRQTRIPSQHSGATSADAWPTKSRQSTIETVSRHVGVGLQACE